MEPDAGAFPINTRPLFRPTEYRKKSRPLFQRWYQIPSLST
jgi:hypothetical protein